METGDPIGAVTQVDDVSHRDRTVSYGDGIDLENPVLFTSLSSNGGDPSVVRFSDIGSGSATFRVQEADYEDRFHTQETVSLLALEEGVWSVGDGRQLVVAPMCSPDRAIRRSPSPRASTGHRW